MIVLDRDGSLIQSDLAANRPNTAMAVLQARVVQRDVFERLRCYLLDRFGLRTASCESPRKQRRPGEGRSRC